VCDVNGEAQGITDDTIKLGTTTPLTGPAGFAGVPADDAETWWFEKIKLDDAYDPAIAQENVRRLEEQEQIFAMTGSIGTPNFVGILPYIDEHAIPAIGPYAPSNQVGVMENPHVWMIWTNFVDELVPTIDYIINEEGAETFAGIAVRGDLVEDTENGILGGLEANDLPSENLVALLPYDSGTTDFSGIAQELKTAGADFIVMTMSSPDVSPLIRAVRAIDYDPGLSGISDLLDKSFVDEFGELWDGLIAPSKIANLETSEDPLVLEFVDAWEADFGEIPTSWNTVGYAQALVTVEVLKNAPALTRDCLEYALENLTNFETGVIPPLTFSADSRQGTRAVGIGMITPEGVVTLREFEELEG
jgi:branched-chain amino acid transport system substrate-binding protein